MLNQAPTVATAHQAADRPRLGRSSTRAARPTRSSTQKTSAL